MVIKDGHKSRIDAQEIGGMLATMQVFENKSQRIGYRFDRQSFRSIHLNHRSIAFRVDIHATDAGEVAVFPVPILGEFRSLSTGLWPWMSSSENQLPWRP